MVIDVRYDIDIGNRVSAKDRTKPFQPDLHGFHDCPRVKNWRIAILRREFLVEHDDPVLRGIVPKAMEQSLEIAVAHVGSMHFIGIGLQQRSEEHTSELQSLMRISYAVFCLNKKQKRHTNIKYTSE